MSQWLHVAGCIRIDAMQFLDGDPIVNLRSSFGNTCSFDDLPEKWDACNVPCGSEGSVQYGIRRTGDDNSMAWGLVYVWGDLRDYENVQEVYGWLKRACEERLIRGCSVKVDVEYQKSYVIYNNNLNVLVMDELPEADEK